MNNTTSSTIVPCIIDYVVVNLKYCSFYANTMIIVDPYAIFRFKLERGSHLKFISRTIRRHLKSCRTRRSFMYFLYIFIIITTISYIPLLINDTDLMSPCWVITKIPQFLFNKDLSSNKASFVIT